MQLGDEDKKRIVNWLDTKCGRLRCPVCGLNQFELAGTSHIWIGFNTHTTRFHYGEGVPVVVVVCLTCGHLVPFSSSIMGLTPDPPHTEEVMQKVQSDTLG